MAGSPMITADLKDDPEFSDVSKNRVARLMREMDLKCKTVKKFIVTTAIHENLQNIVIWRTFNFNSLLQSYDGWQLG